jgi:hypothetical protein
MTVRKSTTKVLLTARFLFAPRPTGSRLGSAGCRHPRMPWGSLGMLSRL